MWDLQRFTQAQLNVLTQQWQRDWDELLAKALVTLQEADHAHQEELELHRGRQHQQDICLHLKEKVSACYSVTSEVVTCFWNVFNFIRQVCSCSPYLIPAGSRSVALILDVFTVL